jgi:hypothetical protein
VCRKGKRRHRCLIDLFVENTCHACCWTLIEITRMEASQSILRESTMQTIILRRDVQTPLLLLATAAERKDRLEFPRRGSQNSPQGICRGGGGHALGGGTAKEGGEGGGESIHLNAYEHEHLVVSLLQTLGEEEWTRGSSRAEFFEALLFNMTLPLISSTLALLTHMAEDTFSTDCDESSVNYESSANCGGPPCGRASVRLLGTHSTRFTGTACTKVQILTQKTPLVGRAARVIASSDNTPATPALPLTCLEHTLTDLEGAPLEAAMRSMLRASTLRRYVDLAATGTPLSPDSRELQGTRRQGEEGGAGRSRGRGGRVVVVDGEEFCEACGALVLSFLALLGQKYKY